MEGLAKLAFQFPFSKAYHDDFVNIAARREAELNGKYRKTLEELRIPEGSPMHQFLKHNWDEELKALHLEHEEGRRNPKAFVDKHRETYLRQKTEPSPWNQPKSPEPPPEQSRMKVREEAEKKKAESRQALKENAGVVAKGTAASLGIAGAGAAAGFTGVKALSDRQH